MKNYKQFEEESDVFIFDKFKKGFKNKLIGPLSFSIKKNRVTAVIGVSGSGKSVILRTLLGATSQYFGKVYFKDIERRKNKSKKFNKHIGLYTQMDFNSMDISAYKYLIDMCKLSGINRLDIKSQISEWLNFFELWEEKDKSIKDYSWGMKNRINLILCFLKDPEILILDEPGANLDSIWRAKIKQQLKVFKRAGKTIIITSHNLDEISEIVDDYVIVDNGKLVFYGSKEQLDIYSKYKIFINEKFDADKFKSFLETKNIKSFKYDKDENSLIFAIKNYRELNYIFLYLIKNNLPMRNLIKLPITMESVNKAIEDNEKALIENKIKIPH